MLIFSPEYTPGLLVPSCHAFGGEMEFAMVLQSTMHHMIMNYFRLPTSAMHHMMMKYYSVAKLGDPERINLMNVLSFPKKSDLVPMVQCD